MRKSNLPPGSGFKKGQSGNPNGRPKTPIELKECLANIPDADYQAIVGKLTELAKKGNTRAIELLLDRWGGKVTQPIELPGVVFKIQPKSKE